MPSCPLQSIDDLREIQALYSCLSTSGFRAMHFWVKEYRVRLRWTFQEVGCTDRLLGNALATIEATMLKANDGFTTDTQ